MGDRVVFMRIAAARIREEKKKKDGRRARLNVGTCLERCAAQLLLFGLDGGEDCSIQRPRKKRLPFRPMGDHQSFSQPFLPKENRKENIWSACACAVVRVRVVRSQWR